MNFKCENNHIFQNANILEKLNDINRKPCPFCLKKSVYNAIEKINIKGLKLVDKSKYKNKKCEVQWECKNGHIQLNKLANLVEKIKRGTNLCNQC